MEFYKLTNETIDLISEKLGELYQNCGYRTKDIMRARLILEESLLKYQNRFGTEVDIYFRNYRVFSQMRFYVRVRTDSFDPFSLEENPMAFMLESMMANFGNDIPMWKYHNLENEIIFTINKKEKWGSLYKIAASVAASAILGIAARLTVPGPALETLVKNYIEPLSDAYSGLFCVMTVLLTLFAITLSIVHIGDIVAAGVYGGKILKHYYKMSSLIVIALTLIIIPFFNIHAAGKGDVSVAAKSMYDILIGFIPSNFVSPFLNFNSVHIMIIGAMFGFSLLSMGNKGETVVNLFDECNMVAIYTNNFINRFIFLYVALKVFAIVSISDFDMLANAGKMVAAIIIGEFLIFIFYMLFVCAKSKMPIKKYIKILMPTFVVCLSSANLSAALSLMVETLSNADIDDDTINLSTNLGSVFFQPACTLVFVFSSLFMAKSYGLEISALWIVTAMVLSIILVAAVPNIPGASVSVFTLLYAQLGLPSAALSMMIAINAILQFVTVGVDSWCLMGECIYMSYVRKQEGIIK